VRAGACGAARTLWREEAGREESKAERTPQGAPSTGADWAPGTSAWEASWVVGCDPEGGSLRYRGREEA